MCRVGQLQRLFPALQRLSIASGPSILLNFAPALLIPATMPRKTTGVPMITDDPKEMEHRLTEYVRDAREALETLAELDPISEEDAHNRESRVNRRYVEALNKLNTARTWLG